MALDERQGKQRRKAVEQDRIGVRLVLDQEIRHARKVGIALQLPNHGEMERGIPSEPLAKPFAIGEQEEKPNRQGEKRREESNDHVS